MGVAFRRIPVCSYGSGTNWVVYTLASTKWLGSSPRNQCWDYHHHRGVGDLGNCGCTGGQRVRRLRGRGGCWRTNWPAVLELLHWGLVQRTKFNLLGVLNGRQGRHFGGATVRNRGYTCVRTVVGWLTPREKRTTLRVTLFTDNVLRPYMPREITKPTSHRGGWVFSVY